MDWLKARRLFEALTAAADGAPHLEGLMDEWRTQLVRYAQLRTRWAMSDQEEKRHMDRHRRLIHNAFIDSTNALSRTMKKERRDIGWRAELGQDRRVIGDFACYVHCILGLRAA